MGLLKSLFNLVVSVTIGPIVDLVTNFSEMDATTVAVNVVRSVVRVVFFGSYFFAMPAFLVTIATILFTIEMVLISIGVILSMLVIGSSISAFIYPAASNDSDIRAAA